MSGGDLCCINKFKVCSARPVALSECCQISAGTFIPACQGKGLEKYWEEEVGRMLSVSQHENGSAAPMESSISNEACQKESSIAVFDWAVGNSVLRACCVLKLQRDYKENIAKGTKKI